MSETISLPYYPSTNRTFGFFTDIDGSQANTSLFQQRSLLLGQMLAGGLAAPNPADGVIRPILVTSQGQVGLLTGVGSMLYEMVKQYLSQDPFGELWILPLADPGGAAAVGGFLFPSPGPYQAGLLNLYVGGILIPVPVLAGDTYSTLAARIVLMVNGTPDVAATASLPTGGALSIVLTAKHVGLLGNDIDIEFNYLGARGGQSFPPGFVAPTVTAMANGVGVPTALSAALAILGEVTFDFIASPYSDAGSLNALDAFLVETAAGGRWSWQQMLFGGYFTAIRGTVGQMAAVGTGRNGKFGSGLMVLPGEPDPVWIHAADYCANCAASLRVDPGVPLQNIVLGTKAPPIGSRITRSLRNTLLYDGISTKTVNNANQNVLERACTFYQTNVAGAPDNSFLDVETIYGLALLIRGWQTRMLSLFPRKKLVIDGTPIPAGSNLVSPSTIKFSTISWYQEECTAGNAQDPDGFAAAIVAQNAGNGLVKELLPYVLVNQLRAIGALAQFTKP